ncbi:hypothetical protein [Flavobacterium sp. LC2016-01]|uniref:hypothetical protein n=1 Tax=Flavobacterium sp. LC2016-01 TaxID=2675876 RepID=UPI0012BA6519|nr:hypothetical protein [Flavobacterium sp. LC2016-01]MTH15903.1 hypothetical protein [Flavobacterium sp. LC2016-01]
MEIIIHTDDAKKLASAIFSKIKNKLETWEAKKDEQGYNIYYHSTKSKQWENEHYVKPFVESVSNQKLYFRVTEIEGVKLDFQNDFGYLLGRFIEVLIVHFSDEYNKIEIK